MRLWHETLIPLLPRQQLLGQHREVAALRGKGWGKKHATVDYVFTHSYYKLFQFHLLVLAEMENAAIRLILCGMTHYTAGKICLGQILLLQYHLRTLSILNITTPI